MIVRWRWVDYLPARRRISFEAVDWAANKQPAMSMYAPIDGDLLSLARPAFGARCKSLDEFRAVAHAGLLQPIFDAGPLHCRFCYDALSRCDLRLCVFAETLLESGPRLGFHGRETIGGNRAGTEGFFGLFDKGTGQRVTDSGSHERLPSLIHFASLRRGGHLSRQIQSHGGHAVECHFAIIHVLGAVVRRIAEKQISGRLPALVLWPRGWFRLGLGNLSMGSRRSGLDGCRSGRGRRL
jgi:hypothetical protein